MVEIGEFGFLGWVLRVIARVLFGAALSLHVDDSTALVAVLLPTVDDLVLADRTVDLGKGVGEVDFAYTIGLLYYSLGVWQ